MNLTATKTYQRTWNGRPGTLTEYHLDGSRTGLRISALKFDDSNDVDVKLVKGDGRKPNFEVRTHLIVAAGELDATVTHLQNNPGV